MSWTPFPYGTHDKRPDCSLCGDRLRSYTEKTAMIPQHINGIGEILVPCKLKVCIVCQKAMTASIAKNVIEYHSEAV